VLLFSGMAMASPSVQKIKPQEVVAKHLESIGTPEARQAAKSIVVTGTCSVTTQTAGAGAGKVDGQVVLASEGAKHLIGMTFSSPDYPLERIGYDGENISVGFLRPGVRSRLGNFIIANQSIFKQGLVGGTLSTSWALLNLTESGAKLNYEGLKKIDNRDVHKLGFLPRRGSDMRVSLYFDAQTFRHVRSEYERIVAARQGNSPDASAGQRESRFRLVEDFSDFTKVNNLTLPRTYKMQMFIDVQSGTIIYDWLFNLRQFRVNQPLDANAFDVNAS